MINRLASILSARFSRAPEVFAGDVDHASLAPAVTISQPQHWLVAMPGKFRPFILVEKDTFDDAVTALEEIAASFEAAHWQLAWETEHVCVISKRCPEGELTGVLSVLPPDGSRS